MNKAELLEKYSKDEDKLLISKLIDKIELCNKRNVITYTDFLDMFQIKLAKIVLNKAKCNFIIFGGFEEASRNIVLVYPDKISIDIVKKSISNYIQIIRINLPKSLYKKYLHKDYLSGVMKLGIKREKFGDIIVEDNGADIIVLNEIAEFVYQNISNLTRFNKSDISIENIEKIRNVEINKKELKVIVQLLRLDNIVSSIGNTSRTKANEIINEGRVYINYEVKLKKDLQIKENDVIVIRGKGKFEINKIEGTTRKNKIIVTVKKYT